MDFSEFLVWLSGAGALLAVSWVFEFFKFPWFENLQPKYKQLVFLGLASFTGIGAKVFLNLAPETWIVLASEYFPVLFGVFGGLFLTDQFHALTKVE